MKKLTLTLALVCITWISINAHPSPIHDEIKEYTASNGVTYRIGDFVHPKNGSGSNGSFQFIYWANLVIGTGNTSASIGKENFILQKIQTKNTYGKKQVVFVVKVNDLVAHTYSILIDEAIAACEITPCGLRTRTSNKIIYRNGAIRISEELHKLQSLKDAGLISSWEHRAHKARIMDGTAAELVVDEFYKLKTLLDSGTIKSWEYKGFKEALFQNGSL